MGRSTFTVDLPKSSHPKYKSEMEVNNIFINYGITDFKQNPMSETDFIKKNPVRVSRQCTVKGVNGLLGNILS